VWKSFWVEAIYDLKLTEAQFMAMTPRQLIWLRERHKQYLEREELLYAIQTSTLANHSFAQPKEAYKPSDFMPTLLAKKKAKEDSNWSREGLVKNLIALKSNFPKVFKVKGKKATPQVGDVVLPANVKRKQQVKQP
jgi:hypothetical protein